MSSPQHIFDILPMFRKDLKVFPGPNEEDGSPTYSLLEPTTGQYYKLHWKESLIFRCMAPGLSPEELAAKVNSISSLKVNAEDVIRFFTSCYEHNLLRVPKKSDYYRQIAEKKQKSLWSWLLFNYLYVRIPLLNPDRFLKRTLRYVVFLGSTPALAIYIAAALFGLFMLIGQFEQFLHTFNFFFNPAGVLIYAVTISLVKVIHEFSHAYVAKRYRLHVPTMGMALIVLWPVLYTDVTDGWKLSRRSERIAISSAGIIAELVIAGFSTIGWVLAPPGVLQSIFFVLATTSIFTTLVINLNPSTRFDGYYILCDLWGIDNLQFRAFNVARWKYLNLIFGINTPCPEENASPGRIRLMTLYAFSTYCYRILLYTSIAFFVYFEFTKVLGIILFCVEIGAFMVWPIVQEIKQVYALRSYIHRNPKLVLSGIVLFLVLFWFIVPLPHTESFPAVIQPYEEQTIYVPANAKIEEIYGKRGMEVQKDQPIIKLGSIDVLKNLGSALLDKEILKKEILIATESKEEASFLAEKQSSLEKAESYYRELLDQEKNLVIKAKFPGTIYSWNENLRKGQYLSQGEVIGKIAPEGSYYALIYVPETDLDYFAVGKKVEVILYNPLAYIHGTVKNVLTTPAETLTTPSLASTYRGPLPVIQKGGEGQELYFVSTYYEVYVEIHEMKENKLRYGQDVTIEASGPWDSKLMMLIRYISRVLIKESSL